MKEIVSIDFPKVQSSQFIANNQLKEELLIDLEINKKNEQNLV